MDRIYLLVLIIIEYINNSDDIVHILCLSMLLKYSMLPTSDWRTTIEIAL